VIVRYLRVRIYEVTPLPFMTIETAMCLRTVPDFSVRKQKQRNKGTSRIEIEGQAKGRVGGASREWCGNMPRARLKGDKAVPPREQTGPMRDKDVT